MSFDLLFCQTLQQSSNMPYSLAIGVEIGGTKIQVGIWSANGKLLKHPIQKQVI